MKTLCEKLILSLNPKLCERDIEMLDRLSKRFDILGINTEILHYSINTILSWLIINELPYKIAKKLVCNGSLSCNIISIDDEDGIKLNAIAQYDETLLLVDKMNRLLGYAD